MSIESRTKFDKKVPPHVREKAMRVIHEHAKGTATFEKARNGLYWHYTLPQYYKVVHHKSEDIYRVMSGQDYAKYQKRYC